MMVHISRARLSIKRGWKAYTKCRSLRELVRKNRLLKKKGYNTCPSKRGGLGCEYPFVIYIKVFNKV